MEEEYYKVEISKRGGLWVAFLQEFDGIMWHDKDEAKAESYQELQAEMGNKGFIDLINKQ